MHLYFNTQEINILFQIVFDYFEIGSILIP